MALPSVPSVRYNFKGGKKEVAEIVKEIGKAIFKSAKVSLDSAAKAVIPSVPDMVKEVLDDLQSGSVRTFNLALDKLDRLVQKLGVDLNDYSKELANFQTKREEKLIKSETKIQALKEQNIIATIEKSGDIKILSQTEIITRQENLRALEKNIAATEKSLEKDRKLLQEDNKLKTTAQANKKQEILAKSAKLEEDKQKAADEKEVLGSKSEEQPGVFQRAREGVGNFVEEYVPTPIADVGSALVEGLMGPINAVKQLGSVFGGLLKPLKLLKPLFSGLIGGLKKFVLGLKASVIAMLPQLALGAVILAVLGLIYVAMKKLQDFLGKDGPSESGLGGSQDTDLPQEQEFAEEGDMSSKMQRTSIVDQETKKIIQPDDPSYDKIYERDTGNPAPKKGQVYMGDGKTQIMSLNKDGFVNSSSNFMNAENRKNLQVPKELTPPEETKKEPVTNVSQINDNSSNNSSSPIIGGGLNGVSNRDFQDHILQNR
jgi:hypothetical protein